MKGEGDADVLGMHFVFGMISLRCLQQLKIASLVYFTKEMRKNKSFPLPLVLCMLFFTHCLALSLPGQLLLLFQVSALLLPPLGSLS